MSITVEMFSQEFSDAESSWSEVSPPDQSVSCSKKDSAFINEERMKNSSCISKCSQCEKLRVSLNAFRTTQRWLYVVHVMCSETSLTFVPDFTLCQNYSKEKKTFRSKAHHDRRAVTHTRPRPSPHKLSSSIMSLVIQFNWLLVPQ